MGSLGITLAFAENQKAKERIIGTYFFTSLPINRYLEDFLKSIGIKNSYLSPLVYYLYSSFQVFSMRSFHGFHSYSISDFLLTTSIISISHYITAIITNQICNLFPIIPPKLIAMTISSISSKIIQRFSLYGVKDGLNWLTEGLLYYISKFFKKNYNNLPEDIDIPNNMTCCICRDLLNQPVESLGFYFCNECINNWLSKGSQLHPVTGENFSDEMMRNSIIMDLIVNKYRELNQINQ